MITPISASKQMPFSPADLMKGRFKTLAEKLTFYPAARDSPKPEIVGLDTEIYTDGSILCIVDSNGRTAPADPSLPGLFSWLSRHNTYFTWNLSFDAMILLRPVPLEKLLEMRENEMEVKHEGVKVQYLYKKGLAFHRGHHTVRLYDAAQLYGKQKLETAAQTFLGEGKADIGSKRFEKPLSLEKLREVVAYSVRDASLTARLADRWIETFSKEFGYYPYRYYSAGSIITEYLFRVLPRFPAFTSIPFKVQEAAYSAYYGGRFEIIQRGTFHNVYQYDINSAYPYAITQMPDFTRGSWFDYSHGGRDDWLLDKGGAGYFRIRAKVPQSRNIAPFMFRLGAKVIVPTGEFETWVTAEELRQVPSDEYRILETQVFGPSSPDEPSPLAVLMRDMFRIRQTKTDKDVRDFYRILMNAIYGKTAQVHPKVGRLFSPALAAYITGYCRAMLLKAIDYSGIPAKDVIAFATDGIFTKSPLNVEVGSELGQWSEKKHETFTVFMNGLWFTGNKARTRGFSPRIVIEGKEVDLGLDLLDIILKGGKVLITNLKPNPLLASIKSKVPMLPGKFEPYEREIDLNADNKRIWERPLKGLNDTNISFPLAF